MQNGVEFSGLNFILESGPVGVAVAIILLVMSVWSWYLIISKYVQGLRRKSAIRQYLKNFWATSTLGQALKVDGQNAFSTLAKKSVRAAEHYQEYVLGKEKNTEKLDISKDEFVARTMNRTILEEGAELEKGLTVLASIGSVAPFVGLFGTVWGIYHALASISLSGQATLDKVAGPVGEALIMTAFGLAVAIPAVLAYNGLLRGNRLLVAQLESFAYELHLLLTTGAIMHPHPQTEESPQQQRVKENLRAVEVSA